MTYAIVLVGPVAPNQTSRSLTLIVIGSDLSDPLLSETANRHMSSVMGAQLGEKSVGTTQHTQVTNTYLPAGERRNKTTIFIRGVSDAKEK